MNRWPLAAHDMYARKCGHICMFLMVPQKNTTKPRPTTLSDISRVVCSVKQWDSDELNETGLDVNSQRQEKVLTGNKPAVVLMER